MSEAFDLWAFLSTLSKRDLQAYEKLTAEAQRGVAPFVLMRWMTGTSDAAQIMRLNTFVNPYAFSLGGEKALLCKLLAAAATGKNGRYSWLKGPGSKGEKLRMEVIKEYYSVSAREASDYKISSDDIMLMSEELGWDDEKTKKLKKELA
jgi:hypothetical protein